MDLATVFKLSLYGLTALVGWILGAAEGGWLPYGSLPVVLVGYWWCEATAPPVRGASRARGMGDTLASIFGFIALTAAANEFFGDHPEGKLLSGTHLVLYLTWIVLLQRKTIYRYWLLLALGVLQVAVASVLQPGSWFGLCAIGYVFAAIWTLSIFSLYRAEEQFAAEKSADASGPVAQFAVERRSQSFSSVRHEDGENWLSMRFASGVVFTSLLGLFVSAMFFALIPRVWVGAPVGFVDEDITGTPRRSVSGFASSVRLGDMGPILESLDPVLELKLFDGTGRALLPQTYAERLGQPEPLFRGAVLSNYLGGVWKSDRAEEFQGLQTAPEGAGVRQEIGLEPIGTEVLFCMGRALALADERGTPGGRHQWITDVTYRSAGFPKSRSVRYTVYSELPPVNANRRVGMEVPKSVRSRYRDNNYLDRNLEIPDGLNRLVALAKQVVADEGHRRGRSPSDLETALAIEAYLRDSGRYQYSLDLSIDDPKIDPVEDFLFNRQSGHCEYFAAALALMLRSAGIPARVITGYKGGELRSDGSLHVQQRFAHAWVEAWIDKRMWVTVDGTPAEERSSSVAAVAARRSLWTDVRSRLSGMWTDNVVNISFDRQEETFYRPLRELAMSIGEALRALWVSPESSLESFVRLLLNPRSWFSAGGIATLLAIAAAAWVFRRLFLRLRGGWFRWHRTRADQRRRLVEFYERFARLMQSRGLQRESTQTQHEFARGAAEILKPQLRAAGLVDGPTAISDLFYRVRFGDETLSEEETRQADELLSRLERALNPSTRS